MLFNITKYAIKNILRNKFLSISSVLVLTLLMFFINILFVVHEVSIGLIESINSKMTISLYLDEKYNKTSEEVVGLEKSITTLPGEITYEYKTKEEILDDIMVREPDLAKVLESSNPLPDTIVLSDIGLEEYESVNALIENKMFILSKNNSDIEHFSSYTSQYEKIKHIIGVLNILQWGLYIIISIFLASIFIITYSIIGNFIFYFRDEIYITRLVGGGKEFIFGPFVLQGGIYSLAAFFLSVIVFIFILSSVNNAFGDLYFVNIHYGILFLEMIVFISVGGLSGFLSSRKYLK